MDVQLADTITTLLRAAQQGDADAEDELFRNLYGEMKSIASKLMQNERGSHTLSETGLLHEAYLRTFADQRFNANDRQHFLRLAARAMKEVLIDHARKKKAAIRGGDRRRESLDIAIHKVADHNGIDVESLNEALERLRHSHPRAAEVVSLKFYGRYTLAEIAGILGVSKTTVDNDWVVARARLRLFLEEDGKNGA